MRSAAKVREQIVTWQKRVADALVSDDHVLGEGRLSPDSILYEQRLTQTARLRGIEACLKDVLDFIDERTR